MQGANRLLLSTEVNYIRLPHAAWMPLVTSGLSQPQACLSNSGVPAQLLPRLPYPRGTIFGWRL
eukprot:2155918-Amphidinium_carterae.1